MAKKLDGEGAIFLLFVTWIIAIFSVPRDVQLFVTLLPFIIVILCIYIGGFVGLYCSLYKKPDEVGSALTVGALVQGQIYMPFIVTGLINSFDGVQGYWTNFTGVFIFSITLTLLIFTHRNIFNYFRRVKVINLFTDNKELKLKLEAIIKYLNISFELIPEHYEAKELKVDSKESLRPHIK